MERVNMSRKTVGLYKRYKFGPCAGVWSINFKRPLEWDFGVIPSVSIPSDLIDDYVGWAESDTLTWKVILLTDSPEIKSIVFYSDILKACTIPTVDKYLFSIPQSLWSELKEYGLRKVWRVVLQPYDYSIWNDSTFSFGAFDQFDIRDCAKRYGGYINDVVNNGCDFGTLFGWLYGEDYSSLYTKWECPIQVPAKPAPFSFDDVVIMRN